jgi:hypothetical protein
MSDLCNSCPDVAQCGENEVALAEAQMLNASYERRLGSLMILREALRVISVESSDPWSMEVAGSALLMDDMSDGDDFEGE